MKTYGKQISHSALRIITATALAIILCVSTFMPVFAEPVPGWIGQAEGEVAVDAAVTKKFIMPTGTPTPTATFTFLFEKVSFNNVTADKNTLPDIVTAGGDPITLSFTSADAGTSSGGTKTVMKETAALLADIDWPSAGVYTYEVTEEQNTGFTNNGNAIPDAVSYSQAKYNLAIWVENNSTGGLYVKYIGATIEVTDIPGDEGGYKVDPTPGGNSTTGTGFSDMVFTNKYLKNNGGTTPNDAVFTVSKTVAGAGANQTSKYFKFDVMLQNPETVTESKQYKAYILQGANVVSPIPAAHNIENANIAQPAGQNEYIEFTLTGATPVTLTLELKHGQTLAFIDLPVGAIFTVKEYGTPDYSPKCLLSAYRVHPTDSLQNAAVTNLEISQTEGNPLIVPYDSRLTTPFKDDIAYIRDDRNTKAAFTNTFKTITPTGIGVDDLPYIVIIGLTLISLGSFTALMLRKNARRAKTRKSNR